MVTRRNIDKVNDRLSDLYGGGIWIDASVAAEIRDTTYVAFDEHWLCCSGRVCHNPEHVGEEVIDVQAVPERKAITDGGE